MKVVILAGGYGTRLSEETESKPKPMVTIGGKPILWHIMKVYSHYGFNDFLILLGYKGYYIKEYFSNYFRHMTDMTIDLENNHIEYFNNKTEPWKITLLDTGLNTMTGGRIKKAQNFLNKEPFLLTYGDGLANIDLNKALSFHKTHGKTLTITSAQPEGRFGALHFDKNHMVTHVLEKPRGDGGWINAGFFICEPNIFEYIQDSPDEIFEQAPLQKLSQQSQIYAYKHKGFWRPMDTLRDRNYLEKLWYEEKAPWKVWK